MAVYADYRGLPASAKGASIALGNFDGLHAGHRAVMDAARLAGGLLASAEREALGRVRYAPALRLVAVAVFIAVAALVLSEWLSRRVAQRIAGR